jgi:two-component system OmpR family response regulator
MRWKIPGCLVTCLVVLLCISCIHAQPLPNYEKILVIRLHYQDGTYDQAEQYIRYGQAPNLNLLTGTLKGVISDSQGNTIRSFFVREPFIAIGDQMEPTEEESPYLQGYVERSSAAEMVITVPYLKYMQEFTLYDTRRGNLLVSVDLSPSLTAFCTGYSNDPDCLDVITGPNPSATGRDTSVVYPAIFALLVLILATMPFIVSRWKTPPDILEKKTVLVVDDEPVIADLIQLLLEKQGYYSITANGGNECLNILKQQKKLPDVILLDIMMQPMDGWDTLEHIKSLPETKHIPVLMLTGKQITAAEAQHYHICIEDYIMKPFEKSQIYAAVEHVILRKKIMRENIVLAKKAGILKDTYCEYAKLSTRIDVNKKLIDLMHQTYTFHEPGDLKDAEVKKIIEQMITNTRSNQTRLEQLKREIFSAFIKKGYPVPRW